MPSKCADRLHQASIGRRCCAVPDGGVQRRRHPVERVRHRGASNRVGHGHQIPMRVRDRGNEPRSTLACRPRRAAISRLGNRRRRIVKRDERFCRDAKATRCIPVVADSRHGCSGNDFDSIFGATPERTVVNIEDGHHAGVEVVLGNDAFAPGRLAGLILHAAQTH
jgi:hypothetical protein